MMLGACGIASMGNRFIAGGGSGLEFRSHAPTSAGSIKDTVLGACVSPLRTSVLRVYYAQHARAAVAAKDNLAR